jgi:hypothetical protein
MILTMLIVIDNGSNIFKEEVRRFKGLGIIDAYLQ